MVQGPHDSVYDTVCMLPHKVLIGYITGSHTQHLPSLQLLDVAALTSTCSCARLMLICLTAESCTAVNPIACLSSLLSLAGLSRWLSDTDNALQLTATSQSQRRRRRILCQPTA